MAHNSRRFQFALTWFMMAAFCGLLGFVVVYHYASFRRQVQNFAIVIDAGSTQTRSSLFTILMDTSASESPDNWSSGGRMPLNKMIEVRQVSSCVNGGPLSALKSDAGAEQLVLKCLGKFSNHIKQLDFITTNQLELEEDGTALDSDEMNQQMALLNHRVNSITHLYLGATAGMRAQQLLNPSKALERILWISQALNQSRGQINDGPFVNLGFVGIIDGGQEAAYGWASANFITNNLVAGADQDTNSFALADENLGDKKNQKSIQPEYSYEELASNQSSQQLIGSVGTIELGGASAQMAYQVPNQWPERWIRNLSLDSQELELFKVKYHLATRSDLCLGMSQAVQRANYVLLRDFYAESSIQSSANSPAIIELLHPCLQNAARVSITGHEMSGSLRGACLSPSSNDALGSPVSDYLSSRQVIRFIGSGDTESCSRLLTKLIEPKSCQQYFSVCHSSQNTRPPPSNMPFVTISGYNKALQVLNLRKSPSQIPIETATLDALQNQTLENERVIAEKLGGYPIDYKEFSDKTRDFCAIDISEFPVRFPRMRSQFYSVSCMQMVYINRLLVDFYKFNPNTESWRQIKFLLFPVSQSTDSKPPNGKPKHEDKNDIGWALGLLLNATSEQMDDPNSTLSGALYHHGSSVMFIMRATVFLMFACVLISLSVLVFGIVSVKYRQSQAPTTYSNPPPSYGASEESSATSVAVTVDSAVS